MVDFLCHGEGERTVMQIAMYLDGKLSKKELKGVTYQEQGKLVTTPPQEMIEDLDEIPFPDRSKLEIDDYHERYNFNSRKPFATILTSRGCPMSCTYCASPAFWGRKVRRRSVENV